MISSDLAGFVLPVEQKGKQIVQERDTSSNLTLISVTSTSQAKFILRTKVLQKSCITSSWLEQCKMKRHRSYSRSKTAIRSFGKCLQNKSDSGCKLLGFNIAEANYWDPRRLGLWFLSPLPQVRCFHIMSLCYAFQLHVHWKKKPLGRLNLSKIAVHWEMNHHWESYQHGHKLQLNIITVIHVNLVN